MYCEYGEYNVFIYFLVTTDEDVHKLHHVENIETCLAIHGCCSFPTIFARYLHLYFLIIFIPKYLTTDL